MISPLLAKVKRYSELYSSGLPSVLGVAEESLVPLLPNHQVELVENCFTQQMDGMVFMACSRKAIFGGADHFFCDPFVHGASVVCYLRGGECFLSQCLGVSLLNMQLGRSAYLITLLNQVIVLVVLCHR